MYDAAGKLIGEYSTAVQTGTNAKTTYTTNDHLGSPRVNTDATGQVASRQDYHPFGEEIARTGYGVDTVRKQFTGYERDGETGLDFARARHYERKSGRFVTVDPLLSTGEPSDPRTWHRYAYALNSPLVFSDPTGLYVCRGTDDQCAQFAQRLGEARANLAYLKGKYGETSDRYKKALASINSYGEDETGKKTNNGVVIKFDLQRSGGKTFANFDGSGKLKGEILVRFNSEALKEDSSQSLVAHEGSHVDDFKTVGNRNDYYEEFDAHVVQSMFAEAQFPKSSYYFTVKTPGTPPTRTSPGTPETTKRFDLWNSSWEGPDKEKLRANAINEYLAVPESAGGPYGLTPPIERSPRRKK